MIVQKKCPVTVDVSGYVDTCTDFTNEMGQRNQSHEFNNDSTDKRDPKVIARDHLIGKMAEVAVYEHLTKLGAKLNPPDFTINTGVGIPSRDDSDLVSSVNGCKFSIKSTAFGSRLMIHEGNAKWDRPSGFVVCRTQMNGNGATGMVTVLGFAKFSEIFDKDEFDNWRENGGDWTPKICGTKSNLVMAGQKSPFANFKFQSTNVYADSGNLRHDLSELVAAINKPNEPEETSSNEASVVPPSSDK